MKTLLSRSELAERWGYEISSITRLEQDGTIHRVKNLQGVRYSIREIEQIESLGKKDLREISFLDYKKLENEKEFWKEEYLKLKNAISRSANDLVKVLASGVELIKWCFYGS